MPESTEFDYESTEQVFLNENKDRVFNWFSGNRYADHENGNPVLRFQKKDKTEEIARIGDTIIKKGIGDFCIKK